MITLLKLLCASGISWVVWGIIRLYSAVSPLDNIPSPISTSWWQGNLAQFLDVHGWKFMDEINTNYGGVVKIKGLFGDKLQPFLYVFDPKALQSIVVQQQNIYEESPVFLAINHLFFGPGMTTTLGETHRRQRKMLQSVFSTKNLRDTMPAFHCVARNLGAGMTARLDGGLNCDQDVMQWMSRAGLEMVGQGILGCSFDPLVVDTTNPLGDALKSLLPSTFSLAELRVFLPSLMRLGPAGFRRFLVKLIPSRTVQHVRYLVDNIAAGTKEVFYAKKAVFEEEYKDAIDGKSSNIITAVLKANLHASQEEQQNEEVILGHLTAIVFAGMDTLSSSLSRIMHLLAQHPHVQEKLQQELMDAGEEGADLSYDQLIELPYLDAIYRETLRLYPPVNVIFRETTRDVVMPLSEPLTGRDGSLMSEVLVPSNTIICVAVGACNRNPKLWGCDAHEWKPERWMSRLPDSLLDARVPGTFSNMMTFFGGGRSCMGVQFAQVVSKVILSVLIRSFKFSPPSEKEIIWKKGDVIFPAMEKNSTQPSMFLNVAPLVKQ